MTYDKTQDVVLFKQKDYYLSFASSRLNLKPLV
jgi:hypothetical protein